LAGWGLSAALLLLALACDSRPGTTIRLWVHSGPGPEREAYAASVAAFNATRSDVRVELTVLPEGTYGDQVHAAAIAGQLPEVLELDGPTVAEYAWARRLRPLDGLPALEAARADLLPSLAAQGTYRGRLYALGQYDAGLALWGNRRLLAKARVRAPRTVDEAWSRRDFERVLWRLKRVGVARPLDLKLNYGAGEWFTFAFAPLVWSLGGDLVDPATGRARGHLDGPAAREAMGLLQAWARAGYIDPAARNDADFVLGRSALSYVGHWAWPTYHKALGRNLVLMPLPRFGERAVTGSGSWCFALSAGGRHPKAAADLLAWLMSPREIRRVTTLNGAIPGTRSALRASPLYRPGGPLALFAEQLDRGLARTRPRTPAYPAISAAFAEAVNNVLAGADPARELGRAAAAVDEEMEDNPGFAGN